MSSNLPTILVTGASGFIGRYFLDAAKNDYRIFGLARRSQKEARVASHPNIHWLLADIADRGHLDHEIAKVKSAGGVDYVLHLAGFYSFDNTENSEYERTNVKGTSNLLESVRSLNPKRFVFASSVVVSEFPRPEGPVTESTAPDAEFPYARSKRGAEKLVREYSSHFPCSVVRMAAVYSDWCEYGPLYMLLGTWLSRRSYSRILCGRGQTGIPYIHIESVNRYYLELFSISERLRPFDTYLFSPQGSVTHKEIFELATRLYYGRRRHPIFVPRVLIKPCVAIRDICGRLKGSRPFERCWMMQYVDQKLTVDPDYTNKMLGLEIRPRFHLSRRLVYLIEHLKSYGAEWHERNMSGIKRHMDRPHLLITSLMWSRSDELVDRIFYFIVSPDHGYRFRHYQAMEPCELRWYIEFIYKLLMSSVRTGDRMSVLSYARYLASLRRREGFPYSELRDALLVSSDTIIGGLESDPDLRDHKQQLSDAIRLTMEMFVDEVEDAYEHLDATIPESIEETRFTSSEWVD